MAYAPVSEWFDNLVADVKKAHSECRVLTFDTDQPVKVRGKVTDRTWDDGVPVMKEFSRGSYVPIYIEQGPSFKVIATKGLASGCDLVYWLRGDIWYCAESDWAEELLALCVEIPEEPSDEELKKEFINYIDTLDDGSLACVLAGTDARAYADDPGDIFELFMSGLAHKPYGEWTREELYTEICDRYLDSGYTYRDAIDFLKAHVDEYA